MPSQPVVAVSKLSLDEIISTLKARKNCLAVDVEKEQRRPPHVLATITAWFQSDQVGAVPLRSDIVEFDGAAMISVVNRDSAELHEILIHSLPKPAIIKA